MQYHISTTFAILFWKDGNQADYTLRGLEGFSHLWRPSYHNDPVREYGMAFAGYNVRFTVSDDTLTVTSISPLIFKYPF